VRFQQDLQVLFFPVFSAALESASSLLCLDTFQFGDALTQKFMVLRGEEITTPLTVEQVRKEGSGREEAGGRRRREEMKGEIVLCLKLSFGGHPPGM